MDKKRAILILARSLNTDIIPVFPALYRGPLLPIRNRAKRIRR